MDHYHVSWVIWVHGFLSRLQATHHLWDIIFIVFGAPISLRVVMQVSSESRLRVRIMLIWHPLGRIDLGERILVLLVLVIQDGSWGKDSCLRIDRSVAWFGKGTTHYGCLLETRLNLLLLRDGLDLVHCVALSAMLKLLRNNGISLQSTCNTVLLDYPKRRLVLFVSTWEGWLDGANASLNCALHRHNILISLYNSL